VALLIALWLATEDRRFGPAPWIFLAAGIALFIWLVSRHRAVESERRRAEELSAINRDAAARVERRWEAMPQADLESELLAHPLARDLSLTGRASLFHLLGSAWTPTGRRALADWLLRPAAPAIIAARQEAVRELAPRLDLRQEAERHGRRMRAAEDETERFLRWAESDRWLLERPAVIWAARVLPLVLLGLVVAAATGPLGYGPAFFVVVVNAVLSMALSSQLGPRLRAVSLGGDELERWRALLHLASTPDFTSPLLGDVQTRLTHGGRGADGWVDRLRDVVHLAELRFSPMLHFPLQLLTLWDVHVLLRLERWQGQVGSGCRDWLAAVGEVDALAALAGLAHDNPDWCFAEVAPDAERWTAVALGHPLIPATARVANDVELGPAGHLVLVTGSNMSGKSTLLRAVGVNLALAQAGGPVCCTALRIPPTRVGTSFVIEDSLSHGISYFMAELRRLREVAEEAERTGGEGEGVRYLFLLDEILKGTNSGERQIAVERIVARLLEAGAAGAVSTHDLELAALPALAPRMRPVHFRESFRETDAGLRMEFDYLLRPGIAPTKNALKLLELVGL
jgi:hypothetical protein